MEMHNPPHPGELLKQDILPTLDLTVSEFAEHLGVSRSHLSKILNGHGGITAEMDLKLSEALSQPPGLWLRMQVNYDLWLAGKAPRTPVKPLPLVA
ncbi:HigA family addiction module antidote protein [Magnetovirga frankeli]|nr:HigA family addiction module antidote protein [gamma proteobacterium SS-5]